MQLIESPVRERATDLLPLNIAFSDYDRLRPLIDGRIVPAGIAPKYTLDDINEGYADLMDGKNLRGVIVHQH